MSGERKEYPFEKTFDVKFDESALKTFNDLIKEKGIRHFKLESDLYGILDVVSYEEYEKLQQKVEQLENTNDKISSALNSGEKEIDRLNNKIKEQNLLLIEFQDMEQRVKQLENIRKEAIEYIEKSMNNTQPFYQYLFGDENGKVENLDKLLNILNKGE